MGATNTTTYYSLSQFVGTDKPAWLQDYNGDMLKIDTGINAAKVAADSAALDASAAQLDATSALNSITNTITPAISSLQTTVGNQGGSINTINSLIGNGTPTTTDQTIIGAINELHSDNNDKVLFTSVATGDISSKIDSVFAFLETLTDAQRERVYIRESDGRIFKPFNKIRFTALVVSDLGKIQAASLRLLVSNSSYKKVEIDTDGTYTYTDISSTEDDRTFTVKLI